MTDINETIARLRDEMDKIIDCGGIVISNKELRGIIGKLKRKAHQALA